MQENELHNLFKSKLQNREFEMNEANWQSMAAMLDGKKAGVGYFVRITQAILAFAAVVALLMYLPFGESSNTPIERAIEPFVLGADKPKIQEGSSDLVENKTTEIANTKAASGKGQLVSSSNDKRPSNFLAPVTVVNAPIRNKGKNIYLNDKMARFYADLESDLDLVDNVGNISIFGSKPKITKAQLPYLVLNASIGANNSMQTGLGENFQLGMQFVYDLGNHFSVYTGVAFAHAAGLDIITQNDSIFFDFGREEVSVENNYLAVQRLKIPLGLQYRWQGNMLQFGAYGQSVLQTQRYTYREVFSTKGQDGNTEKRVYSNYEEINDQQFGLHFSYARHLKNRWWIDLSLESDLSDLTNNEFEQLSEDHRIRSARIGLKYRF